MNNERLCDHTLFMRSILVGHVEIPPPPYLNMGWLANSTWTFSKFSEMVSKKEIFRVNGIRPRAF